MRGYLFYVFLENLQGLKPLFLQNKMNVIFREKEDLT